MRTQRLIVTFLIATLFGCMNALVAQTRQFDLVGTIDNEYILCAESAVSGYWTYHFAYHLNKDGLVDNIHWNIKNCNLVDSEGNSYRIMDTGNDNAGDPWYGLWDLFNNLGAVNAGFNISYNVDDGWLPLPDIRPDEGRIVNMAIKIFGNGQKYTLHWYWHVSRNAKGEIKVESVSIDWDCD